MDLSQAQLENLAKQVAGKLVRGFAELTSVEKTKVIDDFTDKLTPIMLHFPADTDRSTLEENQYYFRMLSIELIVKRMRRVQILAHEPEHVLLEQISEPDLTRYAQFLTSLAHFAFDMVPMVENEEIVAANPISNLLADFDHVDLDEELKHLLSDE